METDRKNNILILGGLGKGGIGGTGKGGVHTFVKEQRKNLSNRFCIQIYNTAPRTGCLLLSFLFSLLKVVKYPFQARPDIVHINSSAYLDFYRNAFYILFSAYVWNRPVVVRFGGSGFDEFIQTESKLKRAFIYTVFSSIDRILVLTDLQKKAVNQYVPKEKIQILPQSTEVSRFTPTFDYEIPTILFLSELNKRKGVPEFLEAIDEVVRELNDTNIQVDIAGDGKFQKQVKKLANKYECIEYHGYVKGNKKIELYNEASIFVLPTHAEGFPSVIIEAMAGGNAIITTDVSGIPEIVGEENGKIIEPGEISQLAESLNELIGNPVLVKKMSQRNHNVAVSNHDWPLTARQLEQIYEELCA